MSSGKGAAGPSLQITLKIQCSFPVGEGNEDSEFPRLVLLGVNGATGIVMSKTGFHIFREADIELSGIFEAIESASVVHG